LGPALNKIERGVLPSPDRGKGIKTGDNLQFIFKTNNMKLRILKKKHPSKLERIWIKHLIEWKSLKWLNKDYKSIRLYYIESCKKHIGL
jgi:hypothetical protein